MKRSLTEIIRGLLNAGWRRRYLIFVPVALMIPLSSLGSQFAPKTYQANTIILLQEPAKGNPFLKDFTVGLEMKDRISGLQTLLKSEHVLADVLRDVKSPLLSDDPKSMAVAVRRLASEVSVTLVGGDLLELKLKGDRPEGLGRTLSAIASRFLEHVLSPEQSSMGATRDFLKGQMELRKKVLDQAENRLSEYKIQNSDKLPAIYQSSIQGLSTLRQKLADRLMELTAADAAFQDIKRQLSGTNPIVGRLEEAIVKATSDLTSLRTRYTPEHSEVQAVERQLVRLREERSAYLQNVGKLEGLDIDRMWSMVAGERQQTEKEIQPLLVSQLMRLQDAQSKRAALDSDVRQLKAAIAGSEKEMSEFSPIEQEQARLERDVSSARENYEAFVRRYDNAVTSQSLGQFEAPDRVKVIDPAVDPTIPSSLPMIVFLIVGIIGGIALGIGMAVVAELLDQKVRTIEQFAALSGAPILVRLPRLAEHIA